MNRTQGRCALVTGASSGIGEAIAHRLASDGLRVFSASRKPSDSPGAGVEPLVLDVTDDDSVRAAIGVVIDKAGRLDVVVNNAGGTLVGALEETSTDEARWLIETNLLGVHRVTRAAMPHLRASRLRGHHGLYRGFPGHARRRLLLATKHALEAYADVLRMEVALFGVRVALVEPDSYEPTLRRTRMQWARRWPSTRKCGVRSEKVSPMASRRVSSLPRWPHA